MNRKGQAAMEFLMTYGWAILAAIIAIGVLAYFGVFNPSRLVSGAAALNPPLNIPTGGFNIVSGTPDTINIDVLQNAGESLTITAASITLTSGGTATCTDTAFTNPWLSGSQQSFVFTCLPADSWAVGDSVAGDVTITYTAAGSTLPQVSTGTVRGVSQ